MKKNFKNFEIENIIAILNHSNSFLKNTSIKLPFEFRQAIRINIKTLTERIAVYEEERKDLIQGYMETGRVSDNGDGTLKIEDAYRKEVMDEINELALVNNELEIVTVDKSIIDKIKSMDISMAEEDVLEFFISEE